MNRINNRQLIHFFYNPTFFLGFFGCHKVMKFNGFPEWPDIVGLPGMFAPLGPAVAAYVLVWRQDGKEGVKACSMN